MTARELTAMDAGDEEGRGGEEGKMIVVAGDGNGAKFRREVSEGSKKGSCHRQSRVLPAAVECVQGIHTPSG
ncbi:unnamed protein product [Linum trigynum]|uniref:Uncharacterized protein n=1 Tax=Linum trigynum TaxID=586398 RepID=A0AAV2EQU1_9ROSI